jgi:hypothetical protein
MHDLYVKEIERLELFVITQVLSKLRNPPTIGSLVLE